MTPETLHHDAFWNVTIDRPHRLVTVTRSAEPFPDLGEAELAFRRMRALLEEHPLPDFRLIVDTRAAIGRNDEAFENLSVKFRIDLVGRFTRAVMLMGSVVGRMQAERIQREHGGPKVEVHLDEASARRALGIV